MIFFQYTLSDTTKSDEYDDFVEDEEDVEIWKQIQKNGTMKACRFNRYVDTNTLEPMVEMEFIDKQFIDIKYWLNNWLDGAYWKGKI